MLLPLHPVLQKHHWGKTHARWRAAARTPQRTASWKAQPILRWGVPVTRGLRELSGLPGQRDSQRCGPGLLDIPSAEKDWAPTMCLALSWVLGTQGEKDRWALSSWSFCAVSRSSPLLTAHRHLHPPLPAHWVLTAISFLPAASLTTSHHSSTASWGWAQSWHWTTQVTTHSPCEGATTVRADLLLPLNYKIISPPPSISEHCLWGSHSAEYFIGIVSFSCHKPTPCETGNTTFSGLQRRKLMHV